MTEKRYYAHKHLLKENKVHDKICHQFMNIDETVEYMNKEYLKYKQLKKENEQLKRKNTKWILDYNGLNTEYEWLKEENEQLKSILEEMKDKNEEIWLMDGRIIRLKKVLKGDLK